MIEGSPEFPAAKHDDDDDVAWALSTALVQWKRGSHPEAVLWLRRAIDSAVSVGATWRAAELTHQTDALEQHWVLGGAGGTSSSPYIETEDLDGSDVIDEEATSLPPDADIEDRALAPLHGDATDELTDVTPEGEQPTDEDEEEHEEIEVEPEPDDEVEIDDVDVLEIDEDDISEDDLGDVDDALPRFASEPPTANMPSTGFKLPYEEEPESEVPDTISEPEPATRSEPPSRASLEPAPAAGRASAEDLDAEIELDVEEEAVDEAETEPSAETDVEPEPEVAETEAEPESTESEPEEEESAPAAVLSSRPPAAPLPPEARAALPSEMELKSEPEAQPEPELPPPSTQLEPFVAGISLADIEGFVDFPPETQLSLARAARVERLATDEEVAGFGLALVLRGSVNVMPTIADVACGSAGERELVYGRGTLPEGVALRLVATAPDTQVAIWDFEAIEPPLAECPWVREELQGVADRYQALAGVSMGPMGDRLDDALRSMVLSRCRLVKLLPDELLVEAGKPVGGLYIVGAGRLKLGNCAQELGPGDFLFAQQILGGGAAPTTARAGGMGTLLMVADRSAAHELMLSVPPLLELLAG
jgi:hypothetical protein